MKKLPIVAIIGKTNAGKSSLLNRLAHRSVAITAREEGTTRDSISARIGNSFIAIDTAGLKDPEDDFEAQIQDQINDAIDTADLILLVTDSTKYPDHDTTEIARLAQKSHKPIILALNKSDLKESLPDYEFAALGIQDIHKISATTGQGIKDLLDDIARGLSPQSKSPDSNAIDNAIDNSQTESDRPEAASIKLALIGRPNVGKSSLFNVLAKKQEAIVANFAGTTRDIKRTEIKYHNRAIELLDTAGLRRRGSIEVGIEKFSAIKTMSAIEEADICALLIDSTAPKNHLDQTLAGEIIEAGKGIILVLTKTDLLEDPTEQIPQILNQLEKDFKFTPYAPVILTSSETGKNATKIFDLTLQIEEARKTEIKTTELNKILGLALMNHAPSSVKGAPVKPKYLVQTDVCPPWFVIHGTNVDKLHFSWLRYLENEIRAKHPFLGTPIRFSARKSEDRKKPRKIS